MENSSYTAFIGPTRIASGSRDAITAALTDLGPHPEGLLVFSDATGTQVDLHLSGTPPEDRPPVGFRPTGAPKPGRPKLGVRAREVTLLPRHWDWLAHQRGGASAALRRLVEDASRAEATVRSSNPDAAYAFLTAIAGDLPGYEAAIRALYAGDAPGVEAAMLGWPVDIREHAHALAAL